MEQKLRYNFVFFFAESDYWKAILGKELYEHENVRVYESAFRGNRLLQFLFKIHWSFRINCKINLPLKSLWFRRMYQQDFNNDLPLCFVYMGGNSIRFDGGFTDYVRKQSPKNRQVILHNDLIARKCHSVYGHLRKKVDIATTYDRAEAEKYGIDYFCETTYSKLYSVSEKDEIKQDVYFLGAAKDRLDQLLAIHEHLQKNGVSCLFMISGVPEDKQVKREGLQYITGISYMENLKHVVESRCILEVIQGGSVDITTRVLEAVAYGKKLLTNCDECNESFFNQGQMKKFHGPEDIDITFIKESYKSSDYPVQMDLNPLRRLYFIQDRLEAKENA